MSDRTGRSPLRQIAVYTRPHVLTLLASGLLRLVNVGVGIALLGLAGYFVATAIVEDVTVTTRQWMIFIGLGGAKALARYLEQVTGHAAAFRILDELRGRMYEWFAGRTATLRSASDSGDIVARAMADVELVEVYFAHTLAPVGVAVPVIAALSVAVGSIAGATTGIAVGAGLVLAGFGVPLAWQRLNARPAAANRSASGTLSAEVTEALAGLTDILTAGAEARWEARITSAGDAVAGANAQLVRRNAIKDIVVDVVLLSTLLVVALGAARADASIATVWAITCAVAGSFGAVLAISRAVDDLPRSAAAAARILEVAGDPVSVVSSPVPPSNTAPASHDIVFRDVTIAFGHDRGLHRADLSVPAGSHVFVAGRSGAGKSTFARLVLGLDRPDDGEVLIGGAPVGLLSDPALRTLTSAAMQRPGLVRGTVLENVAIGSRAGLDDDALPPGLTPAEHAIADDVAGLARLCEDLSLGENTVVGGAHEELSGGQQRRLAIARMIVRDPSIVVLDEAFVGLDPDSASGLRRAVLGWARRSGRTVIEISHELSLAREAERVLVIEHGAVVEDGSPDSLIAQRGAFAALLGEPGEHTTANEGLPTQT